MTHATHVPKHSIPDAQSALRALADRWRGSELKERQAFQTWFREFCDALGVAAPGPDGAGNYCFELPVKVVTADGDESTNFIDCWKAGHVAIEAKASGKGTNEVLLRKAYRQLTNYIAAEPGTIPPYLMVVDVPRELIVWDAWNGRFGGFAIGERVRLEQLADRADLVALLQDIFSNPAARDPRGKALQVTREIAGNLAQLAATFEDRGIEPERVARFLMRCVFCFFAEDVGLLPPKLFERTLMNARTTGGPERVAGVLTSLWRTMDSGGDFGADLIDRFNGHFFQSVESLPLEPADVQLLIEAAGFNWSAVEPSIFGTLLVRALDPVERHKLGAEYTPRSYIERLVEPTVLEPLRARWAAVEVRVKQLEEEEAAAEASTTDEKPTGKARKKKLSRPRQEALAEVQGFHAWLRGLRFLDPACGSGNFLYVTMAAVKDLELEVIREIERLGAREGTEQTEQILDEVHPRQFFGLEVSWWAREIAELTLWIGYHQFWRRAHGGRTPPIPILEDTGTIECRDAILAWDEIVHRPEKDRPDPTPRITSPVTGELIPDPEAKLPYMEYVGARPAEWPEADFIIGNPPYLGKSTKRTALGNGYVDALQSVYPAIPDSADLVMVWWFRCANLVIANEAIQAGLITTNSITQKQNRRVVKGCQDRGIHVTWAIPDHPWIDEAGSAAVRVAMTVLSGVDKPARRLSVDDSGHASSIAIGPVMNSNLTLGVDVIAAAGTSLQSNGGLCTVGFKLYGDGFLVKEEKAHAWIQLDPSSEEYLRPILNGRDIAQRSRGLWVIDFGITTERQAQSAPLLLDHLRTYVKPHRVANRNQDIASRWWQFGHNRQSLRDAVEGLARIIITPETARHRYFVQIDARIAPEGKLVCVALGEPYSLGLLSSAIHLTWASAVMGRLGVGNDPVYNKMCFDPYPFPVLTETQVSVISTVSARLDAHRRAALDRDESVTMTGMYNVVEKLRSGEALTPKERKIHEIAACGVLNDLHDELDALVAMAYGWPWPMEREEILERLVALHDERVAEEKRGLIRWLRPDYQIPRFAPDQAPETLDLGEEEPEVAAAPVERLQWPQTAVAQLEALTALVARRPVTLAEAVASFAGADPKLVARHLETLVMLGEVTEHDGRYAWGKLVA